MERLDEIEQAFQFYKTDKYEHGYAPVYAAIDPQIESILEIGVLIGASMGAWLSVFPRAQVTGVDINLSAVVRDYMAVRMLMLHPRVRLLEGDITKSSLEEYGQFDLVIDDGSHEAVDMVGAIQRCWSSVKPGGRMIVEDLIQGRVEPVRNAFVGVGAHHVQVLDTKPMSTDPLWVHRFDNRVAVGYKWLGI